MTTIKPLSEEDISTYVDQPENEPQFCDSKIVDCGCTYYYKEERLKELFAELFKECYSQAHCTNCGSPNMITFGPKDGVIRVSKVRELFGPLVPK